MEATELDAHLERIRADGYTIVEDAVPLDLVAELNDELARLERELGIGPGGNGFEGHQTWRIYNLLAHGAVFARVPTWSAVLPIVRGVLDDGCLISSISSISIGPGEVAQPIHADDQVMPLPRPHRPVVCNSMWALTDFTEANGATRICPGSHRLDHTPPYGTHPPSVPAEMAAGSVLVWEGGLWHGGGANATDARRVGIAMNYCAGWIASRRTSSSASPSRVVGASTPNSNNCAGSASTRA
ncbi:MAG: phytanoyl-CoA dioxygenase family protein [Ilumatobacteraceae bacterium]